mgnify:CR=1 FL=1
MHTRISSLVSHLVTLTTLATLATLAACSSTPDRNSALDQARSRYNAAQNDAQVATLAPEELKRAAESLRMADKALADGGTVASVDHLAYMTGQRVTIAQETASSKAAQTAVEGAAAERDRMRLASRTREAEVAQQQLAASQQTNAIKDAELANAGAAANAAAATAAMREQAIVDRSNARVNDLEMQLKDLNAKKTDRGMVVTLGDVLFDSGQARLLADGNNSMVKIANVFRDNPQRKALIEGYTDSVGGADANYALSERRASAVMSALVNLGVPAERLSMKAHGEEQPVASNSTAAGRQLNRRVEVLFTQ